MAAHDATVEYHDREAAGRLPGHPRYRSAIIAPTNRPCASAAAKEEF